MNTIIECFRDPGLAGLIMFIVAILGIAVSVLLWVLNRLRPRKTEKAARKDAGPTRPRKRYTQEDLTRRKRDS